MHTFNYIPKSDRIFVCGCGGSGTTAISFELAYRWLSLMLPVEDHRLYFAWRTDNQEEEKDNLDNYHDKTNAIRRKFNPPNFTNTIPVIDHTPVNIFSVEYIKNIFPDSYWIFVTRNPLDVIYNLTKRLANPFISYREYNVKEALEVSTQRWIDSNKALISATSKPQENHMLLRYEDFNPENIPYKTRNEISNKEFKERLLSFNSWYVEQVTNAQVTKLLKEGIDRKDSSLFQHINLDLHRFKQYSKGFNPKIGSRVNDHNLKKLLKETLSSKEVKQLSRKFNYIYNELDLIV